MIDLRVRIRDIPDFPKPGIVFRDITPLLADGLAFRAMVDRFVERYRGRADMVLGIESRGFLIGAAVAYELEYGSDALEIHHDAVADHHRVLIIDDLLATGGTASAAVELVRQCGGSVVGCGFVIELAFLEGRRRLRDCEVFSL